MTPALSIVIPTYNRRALLQGALRSALRQEGAGAYEVVVADDGSQDGTWEYLESVRDARVRAVRIERRVAMGPAWNRAVRESRGAFVLVLQDDDLAEPSLVRTIARARAEHPEAELICSATWLTRGDTRVPESFWQPDAEEVLPAPEAFARFSRSWTISATQVVFARSAYDRYGGFDETPPVMSDAEAILRWMLHCDTVVLPDRLTLRRLWPGSETSAKEGTAEMAETMAFVVDALVRQAVSSGRFSRRQRAELAAVLRATFLAPPNPVRARRATSTRSGAVARRVLALLRRGVRTVAKAPEP